LKRIDLIPIKHSVKIGDICDFINPNVSEDSIFYLDDQPIGFFIKEVDGKLKEYLHIANTEFRSDRVPKQEMSRGPQGSKKDKLERQKSGVRLVTQYSTILGSRTPKPHMRMNYASRSAVHSAPSAKNFVKAMLLACKESEKIIKKIMPEQYEKQRKIIADNVPEKYRFGELFTSSISNYNISAPFHRDAGNLIGCVNVILTKRENATGGNLNVPDYGATIDQTNNSMLVYPAWQNLHGVTPISPRIKGGYRNSLIFYPLKGFKGL